MVNLAIAFTVAVAGVLLSSLTLAAAGLPKEIAGSISSVVMGGVPYIHKSINQRGERQDSRSINLLSFEGFGISAPLMTVYASLMMIAAIQVGSGIGGLMSGAVALGLEVTNAKLVPAAVGITVIVTTLPVTFFIGRWVGVRCDSHGFAVVVLCAVVGRLASSIIDYSIVTDQQVLELYGARKSIAHFSGQLLSGSILLSIFALIGNWRGRNKRLAFYFAYLIKAIRPEDREALISLAYDEAQKTLTAPKKASDT